MPIYVDDVQLYSCFQALFGVIEDHDPKASDALVKACVAITVKCSAPAALITIDARRTPVQVLYGRVHVKPTIEVGMTADTLHCLLLGEIRLAKAIGSDLVNLKGPVWKTFPLADIFHHAQRFYPNILAGHGLPAICPSLTRS